MLSRQNGAGVEALAPFFMITLLSESKTMESRQEAVSPDILKQHTPVLEETADNIMSYLATLSPLQISQNLGISIQLGKKAHDLAYDFNHKLTGYPAIFGFTGEAFRAFDVKSLDPTRLEAADEKLRIISSVYGILKPHDIIKPYRCEFNKPVTSDSKTPIQIFKSKVTIEFVKLIKENKVAEVIDLLPADADKCLDWKIIRAFTSVQKICFQVITNEGKLKTPLARRLKELRGLMARDILEKNIQTFEQLKTLESENYIFSPQDSKTGLPVFISSE